jgi:hypothetical protein
MKKAVSQESDLFASPRTAHPHLGKLNSHETHLMLVDMVNRTSVVVDPVKGDFSTIEEALEKVKPNTTIYLAEGVYTIKTPIFIPGLIFEKKDAEKPVYIVGSDGPVVNIVLNSGETVMFKKITFMHTGVMIASKFIENAPNEPEY